MGVWKGDYDDSENATMAIYEDSIYNVEHFTSMFYEVVNDSLIQYVDGMPFGFQIVIASKDTLLLRHADGEVLYTAFRD